MKKLITATIITISVTACATAPKPGPDGRVPIEEERAYQEKKTQEIVLGAVVGTILGITFGFRK